MRSNIIYFPYIRVPESAWFTRILLYWDQVASIIPSDYLYEPERLGEHTRSLIEHELIRQIHPGAYVWEIPSFLPAFAAHVTETPAKLEQRRDAFQRGETFKIHMEKMGPIEDFLCDEGLAQVDAYPWFSVEKNTATEFMAYLAACLGRINDIDASPVSDEESSLAPLVVELGDGEPHNEELEALRCVVLEELFPAPERPLSAGEIAQFREKYGDTLREFRRRVEREVLALAELRDENRRARRLELFRDELDETVKEIRTRLEESGAGRTLVSKLWSVALAIPGMPPAVGLINAIGQAFKGAPKEPRPLPLAYAARAQLALFDTE
ncbi:MAG: hypothetical protein JSV33_15050 [bacterium]|nr:MAG: hypothetical protein JSV33_15050 [bacterium]